MNNQQELIDEYLYYCLKQRKLDEKTVRAYRIDLRQFSEFCVQKKLVTEKAVIRQYILHLHESYKQKTVKRKVASIKAFYSYLEDEEIIDDSPLRKIRTEFREEKILPRSIPYSVLQSLLSSMYSKKSIESTIYERKLSNNENFKLHRFLDLRSKCLYSSINYMISYVTYGLNARLIQKYTKYGYISSNTRGRDSGAI